MADYPESVPAPIALMATMMRHCAIVKQGLQQVSQELDRRALAHDLSKLGPEELPGFIEINQAARVHPHGSDEYMAALNSQRGVIDHHYTHNSHHPEYHADLTKMGFLDIIEMVCDWWSATVTYGNSTWEEALAVSRDRWKFTDEQWWLVEQVADMLSRTMPQVSHTPDD